MDGYVGIQLRVSNGNITTMEGKSSPVKIIAIRCIEKLMSTRKGLHNYRD